MRAIPKLIENELFSYENAIKARVAEIARSERLPAKPGEIYEILLGLPDLVRILADIQISEDFGVEERYSASYAFSYLIFKDDYIPDSSALQIGYLDDLVVIVMIVRKLHETGPDRFKKYEIRGRPFEDYFRVASQQCSNMLPRAIHEKIVDLLSPILKTS